MNTNTNLRLLTSAGTAAVTGNWFFVGGGRGDYSYQAVKSGTVTAGTITLEASDNGIDAGTTALGTFIYGTDTDKDVKYVTGKPTQYIRAKTGGMVGGGTVDVWAGVAV